MGLDMFLTDEIVFNAKPDAVPYNYRISYKIGQLCLILAICGGRKSCSYLKLHMIAIGLSNDAEMYKILKFSESTMALYTLVRFDPAVTRAIRYAVSDGLIKQLASGSFQLTTKGKEFVMLIQKDDNLLVREKRLLHQLSTKLSEEKIKNLIDIWGSSHASS